MRPSCKRVKQVRLLLPALCGFGVVGNTPSFQVGVVGSSPTIRSRSCNSTVRVLACPARSCEFESRQDRLAIAFGNLHKGNKKLNGILAIA
jgi:hypothetical protein